MTRRRRSGLIGGAVLGLLVCAGLAVLVLDLPIPFIGGGQGAAEDGSGGEGRQPVEVSVARVVEEVVPIIRRYSGRLVATRQVQIRPRVSGYIEQRLFTEGAMVEEGELLYHLDERPFLTEIKRLRAQREGARAQLDYLTRQVERIQELTEEDYAPETRLDELVAERLQARATVDQLAAEIEGAELDLDYASIEAPFAGRVGFARAEAGTLVSAEGEPLTDLVRLDPIWAQVEPSERDLRALEAQLREDPSGLPATIELSDGGHHPEEGRLLLLENEVSPQTGTILARIAVPNPERTLLPGQFVRAEIVLRRERALLVPTEALVAFQGQEAVHVVGEDGRVETRRIETGRRIGQRTVVLEGLEPGLRVASSNLQAIDDGTPVTVVEPAAGDGVAMPAVRGRGRTIAGRATPPRRRASARRGRPRMPSPRAPTPTRRTPHAHPRG